MIKKKILSIVIPSTKVEELKKCLGTVFEHCDEKQIQVIVIYPKGNRELKQYIKEVKKEHRLSSFTEDLVYAYPNMHIPIWMKKCIYELKLQKRKVTGAFISDVVKMTALYHKGIFFACGNYILYMSQEMRLTEKFWESCIEPLKGDELVGAEVILANQVGEHAIFKQMISKHKKKFTCKEGTREVLSGLHTMSYAVIWKRKSLKETKNFIEFTTADAYYFMEMNLLIRMQESETRMISDSVLEHEVSKLYKESFDNLKYPVERLAFLRGLRRYFGTIIVERKINIDNLICDIEYCENDYQEFLDYMISYYKKENKMDTVRRYQNLSKSLLLVDEREK